MNSSVANLSQATSSTPSPPIVNEHWPLFVSLISISAICLLVTLVIYILIWEKHNCHGFVQFSYLLALFMFDCVFIPALSPGLTAGGHDRNALCFTLAVCNQYFFICAKTWLIIISLDIFRTIRKMRVIAASGNKNLRRFACYAVVGWTFPFLFVSAGVIQNLTNRNLLLVKVEDEGLWATIPDYGFLHCRIPNWFWWECFVFSNCIFHFSMFFLISVAIFVQRRATALAEVGSNVGPQSPIMMLLRLFIVVGLSWSYIALQDLLRAGNINTRQTWGWQVFRCIYFLQGAFISIIILSNGRTIKKLVTKHPRLQVIRNAWRLDKLPRYIQSFYTRKESLQSLDSRKTVHTVCG